MFPILKRNSQHEIVDSGHLKFRTTTFKGEKMLFENLNLIEPIQKALKDEGYIKPTPIQENSIPPILEGKDFLGCAQTGTGKTAAFAIPILQNLLVSKVQQKDQNY